MEQIMFQIRWGKQDSPKNPVDSREYSNKEISNMREKKVLEPKILRRDDTDLPKEKSTSSNNTSKDESTFQLARLSICGFFGTYLMLILSIVLCDFSGVKSDNIKWALDKFTSSTSPVVASVIFYYYGKAKDKE